MKVGEKSWRNQLASWVLPAKISYLRSSTSLSSLTRSFRCGRRPRTPPAPAARTCAGSRARGPVRRSRGPGPGRPCSGSSWSACCRRCRGSLPRRYRERGSLRRRRRRGRRGCARRSGRRPCAAAAWSAAAAPARRVRARAAARRPGRRRPRRGSRRPRRRSAARAGIPPGQRRRRPRRRRRPPPRPRRQGRAEDQDPGQPAAQQPPEVEAAEVVGVVRWRGRHRVDRLGAGVWHGAGFLLGSAHRRNLARGGGCKWDCRGRACCKVGDCGLLWRSS